MTWVVISIYGVQVEHKSRVWPLSWASNRMQVKCKFRPSSRASDVDDVQAIARGRGEYSIIYAQVRVILV